jgi:hypothetical protein
MNFEEMAIGRHIVTKSVDHQSWGAIGYRNSIEIVVTMD